MLARRAAMSERTFARRFAAETGTTPGKWLLAQRLHHARTLLESSDLPVETVAVPVRLRLGRAAASPLRHPRRRGTGGVPPYVPHPGRARRLSAGAPRVGAMTYPPAPWNMHGQLWLSLFRVREGDHPEREPGVYGAALVSYEQPSPLTYSELLVARPVKAAGGRRVNITDIWVDSADSRDGGRDAVGDPEGAVRLPRARRPATGCSARRGAPSLDGAPDRLGPVHRRLQRDAPRTPFKGSTWQERRPTSRAGPRGRGRRSRAAPRRCRAAAPGSSTSTGPLAWLAGKRPLASFRMADFQMSFG